METKFRECGDHTRQTGILQQELDTRHLQITGDKSYGAYLSLDVPTSDIMLAGMLWALVTKNCGKQ